MRFEIASFLLSMLLYALFRIILMLVFPSMPIVPSILVAACLTLFVKLFLTFVIEGENGL